MATFEHTPEHIAFIMDGNGRWAQKRGLARTEGHRRGKESAENIVRACNQFGIQTCTLFAFSTENWKRPRKEVDFLMALMENYLSNQGKQLDDEHICFRLIGDRTKLPDELVKKTRSIENTTQSNNGMRLQIALNYGGRWDITHSCQKLAKQIQKQQINPEDITPDTLADHLSTAGVSDPDILVRTGGEKRLSNFMLWDLAYTELFFSDTLWPDFDREELTHILEKYQTRNRRFGQLDTETNGDTS